MSRLERARSWQLVLGAVLAAVAANLLVYAVGRAAGGSFDFSAATGPVHVDAATVAGFTAIPLGLGLTLAAVLGRWWSWVVPTAMVIAPVLELGTIFVMTIPSDHDLVSTITLAATHVALIPVTVLALALLGRRRARSHGSRRSAPAITAEARAASV